MKFLVQLRFKPDSRDAAVALFEQNGPNRNPGVSFRHGWIDTRSHIAFVVVESHDEAQLEQARQVWAQFGETTVHPVVDLEQY